MTIETHGLARDRLGLLRKAALIGAPLAAVGYPWALRGFNVGAVEILAAPEQAPPLVWLAAGSFLALAFAVPLIGLLAATRLARIGAPTTAEQRAKIVALLVVATPAIYTFLGVVDYMANSPIADEWASAMAWALLALVIALSPDEFRPAMAARPAPAAARIAHGVAAVAIIGLFLAFHLANHLAGLIGPEAHRSLMKTVRAIYGSAAIEPVLIGLFLFQVASGLYLALRRVRAPADGFEIFQIAAGVYLAFFIVGHMNSVFIFARAWSDPPIVTDWSFATGETWGGLIESGWSNRLIPHYAFGVFFALAHIGAGVRMVMIGHGLRERLADRAMIGATVASFVVALAIMLGMCGVRLNIGARMFS